MTEEIGVEVIGVEAMRVFFHSNLRKLATLSRDARQQMEVRVRWAYIHETPPDVVCGLCRDHDHSDADTRLWMCPMRACGRSAWHDACLEGMYRMAARAGRMLAFGCPACGTGWWLRSEMSAEGARLREEWEEFQMQQLLQGVDQMNMPVVQSVPGVPGVQQQGVQQGAQQPDLEQERLFRHLLHLFQHYQQNRQQVLEQETHLRQLYEQYKLNKQQQQYHQTQQTQQNSMPLLQSELWVEDT
ncbi:hypothetical protein BO86DRAFT_383247 [Aspergillus japonicus CBS 114.51]|uniref:RING-type domain-containing protein n=2 Tax=Aspergillus TaxID=5052 RepID=A0A2V5GV95_ASPV1|nr:hypothetical protein BO86DRAFT_383247 [Aspergillus japonicus CBS 114.51]PYI15118.1 hypothetical protein BO99DRAFT_436706 [Aspergillus violaceofuscus CBS 115571]RAH77166.1 hypothetical protein BO86DRAFT_383247 [Aspergillus japonicus CBS 114.51]